MQAGDNFVVYVDNVPVDANVSEFIVLYGRYGRVQRVKILCQYYQCDARPEWGELEYPAGIALVQFESGEARDRCIVDKNPMILHGHVLQNYGNGTIIQARISKSVFVFFLSPRVDKDFIAKKFIQCSLESVEILHPVLFNRPGMAIVTLAHKNLVESAVGAQWTPDFCARMPLYELELLEFDTDDVMPPVTYTPSREALNDMIQFENWFDMEVKYLDRSFKVNSFLASAFSAKIRRQTLAQVSGPSSRLVVCDVTYPGPFEQVVKVLMGQPVQINVSNAVFLLLCARDLEIRQLEDATKQLIDDMSDYETMFKFCTELSKAKLDTSLHIKYFAKNFDQVRLDPGFRLLPLDVICSVFELPEFTVKSKDALAEWLLNWIEKDDQARTRLIQYVPLQSMDGGDRIRALLSKTGVNMNSLRDRISELLRNGTNAASEASLQYQSCEYNQQKPTEGVFGYLKKRYGNALDVVEVTGTNNLAQIIDPQSDSTHYYASPSIQGMWIQFDFRAPCITLTNYTIQTASRQEMPHMKSWALEGSRDGIKWTVLHKVDKTDALKGPLKLTTLSVKSKEEIRYVRIRQTDVNWSKSHVMLLRTVEFYGNIRTESGTIGCLYRGKDWSGIFDHLSREGQMNPAQNGVVVIKTAADPENLVNPEWSNSYGMWRSADQANPFVMFHFMQGVKVAMRHYLLKTYMGPSHAQTWVVEGSNDGVRWHTIDSRKNCSELKKGWASAVFSCQTTQPVPYSFIRIKMTDQNSKGSNIFWLSNVEFYGRVHIDEHF